MPDKKEDTKTTIVESATRGGMSAIMPYIALGGVAYLGYRALSGVDFGKIGAGIQERITERIESITNTIENTTKKVYDRVKDTYDKAKEDAEEINDTMNDTPGLNLFALDIQRKEEMTDTQKWALSQYEQGNVNYHTITGGRVGENATLLDVLKNSWSKETLADFEIMFLPKGKNKPLKFLSPDSELSKEQQKFFESFRGEKKDAINFNESPFLDIGLGSPLENIFSGNTTNTENNTTNTENNKAKSKKDKTLGGKTFYRTAARLPYTKTPAKRPSISQKNPVNKKNKWESIDKKIAAVKKKIAAMEE